MKEVNKVFNLSSEKLGVKKSGSIGSQRSEKLSAAEIDEFIDTVGRITAFRLLEKGQDIKQFVKYIDLNGNGFISPVELKKYYDDIGVVFPEADFSRMCSHFDLNSDKKIDIDELITKLTPSMISAAEEWDQK